MRRERRISREKKRRRRSPGAAEGTLPVKVHVAQGLAKPVEVPHDRAPAVGGARQQAAVAAEADTANLARASLELDEAVKRVAVPKDDHALFGPRGENPAVAAEADRPDRSRVADEQPVWNGRHLRTVAELPQRDLVIVAGGGQPATIGVKGKVVYRTDELMQPAKAAAGGKLANPHGTIVAARRQPVAAGMKGKRRNHLRVIREVVQLLAAGDIPDLDATPARGEMARVGESGTFDYDRLLRGYREDVCCEVSSMVSAAPGYDALAAARTCYRNMAHAFEQARIPRG